MPFYLTVSATVLLDDYVVPFVLGVLLHDGSLRLVCDIHLCVAHEF